MISFEHQGWTVQIFASAAPARPLIVLPTFAEAVAPVREALADAPDFTLVTLSGFDWEGDLSPWPAPALGKNSAPFAGHADAALALLSEELLPQPEANKGYGNSTTLPADVTTEAGAQRVLLSLCETVAMRLRRDGKAARCISVSLRSADFVTFSHQTMLREAVHGTEELFRCACRVFAEAWDGQTPLRQLGVQATRLEEPQPRQLDLFAVGGAQQYARKAILDGTVDALREKYGEGVIRRARFTGADTVLAGGLSRERRTGITKPLDAE